MSINPVAKRFVPVVTGLERVEDAVPLAKALLNGGLNVVEITFRSAAAEPAVRAIRRDVPEMIVGAGTLLNPSQVRQAKEAGAHFGVSPGLNLETVTAAKKSGLMWIPGVMTPSEVENALNAGCQLLKFFPANVSGGVAMLKALAGPYGQTGVKFIALGGITTANIKDILSLPMVAAVGGSLVVDPVLINKKDWSGITSRTKEVLEMIK